MTGSSDYDWILALWCRVPNEGTRQGCYCRAAKSDMSKIKNMNGLTNGPSLSSPHMFWAFAAISRDRVPPHQRSQYLASMSVRALRGALHADSQIDRECGQASGDRTRCLERIGCTSSECEVMAIRSRPPDDSPCQLFVSERTNHTRTAYETPFAVRRRADAMISSGLRHALLRSIGGRDGVRFGVGQC